MFIAQGIFRLARRVYSLNSVKGLSTYCAIRCILRCREYCHVDRVTKMHISKEKIKYYCDTLIPDRDDNLLYDNLGLLLYRYDAAGYT